MKVTIELHKNIKKSPYRVRCGQANVYVSTLDEAKRVKRFALKLPGVDNVKN